MNAAAPDHHDARPSAHTSGHSTPPRFRAVAISGSLRRGSSNTALIRVAQRVAHEQLPADLHVEIVDWIDQLPWMNPDLEDDLPEAVIRWRELVREADALIIGLPEYNYGPSPLAKNAIDWITRPPHDRVITGKVIAFMSSAGRSGGANTQQGLYGKERFTYDAARDCYRCPAGQELPLRTRGFDHLVQGFKAAVYGYR